MSTVTNSNPLASTTGTASTSAKATSEASDRFLKLLVTQMQNQDPLNPMDNAQVTSQMAQINTVEEMVNMISASRSYQNNVEVMNTTKSLLLKTLQMGQGS